MNSGTEPDRLCCRKGSFPNYSAAPEQTSCLTVTMEQPTALYLRGFTGDTFTGTAWQALDAQTLAEQTDLLYWLHKEGFYPQTQLAAASRGLQRQEQAQTVLIENTSACSAYVYAPYALSALPQESALRTDSLESTQLPASGLRGARQYRLHHAPCPGADRSGVIWTRCGSSRRRQTPTSAQRAATVRSCRSRT